MCVKLSAAQDIQLEYVFYTWGNAQCFWVPFTLWGHFVLQ